MTETFNFLSSVMRELCSTAAQGAAYESWSDEFARKEVREVWKDETAPLRNARHRRVSVEQLQTLTEDELGILGFMRFDNDLRVVPLWAWHYIANGETLICIFGDTLVKNEDPIDLDVRGGCIAYGFVSKEKEENA